MPPLYLAVRGKLQNIVEIIRSWDCRKIGGARRGGVVLGEAVSRVAVLGGGGEPRGGIGEFDCITGPERSTNDKTPKGLITNYGIKTAL